MTSRSPESAGPPVPAEGDALAGRILAAHRLISLVTGDPAVRIRLHKRLLAICAALKAPEASVERSLRRLDRLMDEAEQAAINLGFLQASPRPDAGQINSDTEQLSRTTEFSKHSLATRRRYWKDDCARPLYRLISSRSGVANSGPDRLSGPPRPQ